MVRENDYYLLPDLNNSGARATRVRTAHANKCNKVSVNQKLLYFLFRGRCGRGVAAQMHQYKNVIGRETTFIGFLCVRKYINFVTCEEFRTGLVILNLVSSKIASYTGILVAISRCQWCNEMGKTNGASPPFYYPMCSEILQSV